MPAGLILKQNQGWPQGDWLLKLNKITIHQMKLLMEDNQINALGEKETASGRE
jgi:hypothetical protein